MPKGLPAICIDEERAAGGEIKHGGEMRRLLVQ